MLEAARTDAGCGAQVVRVMAACQSLVAVGRDLVGDPLEKAAFAATGVRRAPYPRNISGVHVPYAIRGQCYAL